MGEELAEHKGMIRLRVVPREPDIFVHIERNDVLEPICTDFSRLEQAWFAVAHDNLPSLTILIRALYVGIGEDPVGNPSTKGFSAVGLNSLILVKSVE